MRKLWMVVCGVVLVGMGCRGEGPAPWDGPVLVAPRGQLTVAELEAGALLPLMDLSFFARPAWAADSEVGISGVVSFGRAEMDVQTGWSVEGGASFPAFEVELLSVGQRLVPRERGVIEPSRQDRYWDVIVGVGAVWREEGDGAWRRASLPISLIGRYVGEVRNCVVTFVYNQEVMSRAAMQCSQETAVRDAQQLGDIRAMLPLTYAPQGFDDAQRFVEAFERAEQARIPTAPLARIDRDGEIAAHFDRNITTRASTSLGAVYTDGTLYVHPPRTRHGVYPYPDAMRHGVFSVTKSMAGALAMFYFAERYGPEIFEARITDHVPALAERPEWQGVTFAHALNMVTGTRAGETGDLLYEPLELAPDAQTAIENIAAFGDYPEAPGQAFNYATTNTFVLSHALDHYVKQREGQHVHYWDLVHQHVLTPIGAEGFGLLHTRDANPEDRLPILGLGAYPTLDQAAKIARLIQDEGAHHGVQLLHRGKIREALGRTTWEGYPAFDGLHYSHSLWSRTIRTRLLCRVRASFMEGLGDNRVVLLPYKIITFQFTDEFDDDLDELVNAVDDVRGLCG